MTNVKAKESDHAIHGALTLNYKPTELVQYYDDWANSYDQDVHRAGYAGPDYIADYLCHILKQHVQTVNSFLDLKILDAGCGTGLVGKAMYKRGYRHIEGFDLCASMIAEAEKTEVYKVLKSGCDLTKRLPYSSDCYAVTVCCGVFTQGHVPPQALNELVRITNPGGILLVSTRKSYYESTEFEDICQQLETAGLAKRVSKVMDGPYLEEEGAHYWTFLVS